MGWYPERTGACAHPPAVARRRAGGRVAWLGALALQAWLSPVQVLLGGSAFNLIAQGMGVIALRMLFGEPSRWRLVVVIGVVGYLGVAWFGLIEPDYRARVLWSSLAIIANILLQVQALVAGPFGHARCCW